MGGMGWGKGETGRREHLTVLEKLTSTRFRTKRCPVAGHIQLDNVTHVTGMQYVRVYTHTHTCAHKHTMHAHVHMHTHTHTHAHTNTMHACARTHTHTHIYTHTRAHIHTHIYTHTHTQRDGDINRNTHTKFHMHKHMHVIIPACHITAHFDTVTDKHKYQHVTSQHTLTQSLTNKNTSMSHHSTH